MAAVNGCASGFLAPANAAVTTAQLTRRRTPCNSVSAALPVSRTALNWLLLLLLAA